MSAQSVAAAPRPGVGQVWRSRHLEGRYVAVLEVRKSGRVRFAPVQVSSVGRVTRDVRCSRSYWETPAGLNRAFVLTRLRLELVPRSAARNSPWKGA